LRTAVRTRHAARAGMSTKAAATVSNTHQAPIEKIHPPK
jgi:hypothetical protein